MMLSSELLMLDRGPEFHAVAGSHGLYNTFQFVLRLSPRVHRLLAEHVDGTMVKFDEAQAMSTYLHETVHWWQHIGSTYGFILGLNYPVQTHAVVGRLKELLAKDGFKKSILERSKVLNKKMKRPAVDSPAGAANIIVNNHFDLEVFREFTLGPDTAKRLLNQPLFEAVGHAFHMTYGHTLHALGMTVDPNFSVLPNPDQWNDGFRRLRDGRKEGYYFGSPVGLWPIGSYEIFEGQARFIQIQYLFYGTNNRLDWKDFADLGMLGDRYIRAFLEFLKLTESPWPEQIDHPLVGLFLLICDMSINPGNGFPFSVAPFFETFLTDVNPGARFTMLSRIVGTRFQSLRSAIRTYSRDEYSTVSSELAKVLVDYPPLRVAEVFSNWFAVSGELASLRRQYDIYEFSPHNYALAHLFAHFLAFQQSKFAHPEFFCWPGVWMAGDRISNLQAHLFEKHSALFVDKEDDDGVFPRLQAGRNEKTVHDAYERFYASASPYDLVSQWIRENGPFRYDISWLSSDGSKEVKERFMRDGFKSIFEVDPEEAEILRPH